MNFGKSIMAAILVLISSSAFAQPTAGAIGVAAATEAAVWASVQAVPQITVSKQKQKQASRTREEVKAEAVEFVKNYKTTLEFDLDLYK